ATSAGAALLLGSSIGGELLNPGAPEFQTIMEKLPGEGLQTSDCVRVIAAPLVFHLGLATLLFWAWNARVERSEQSRRESERYAKQRVEKPPEVAPAFHVNLAKALVPIVPLVLLFLTGPPLEYVHLDRRWLVGPEEANASRLV